MIRKKIKIIYSHFIYFVIPLLALNSIEYQLQNRDIFVAYATEATIMLD